MKFLLSVVAVGAALLPTRLHAASSEDYSNLKKEVEDLRKKLNGGTAPKAVGAIGRADATVANRYGPGATVTTKKGKLTIGGLLQVWTYSIQNDNRGVNSLLNNKYNETFQALRPFSARSRMNGWNSNELNDNDGYRIRRAEIKLSVDINDDITGVVMVDPTGGDEGNTFPSYPTNQGVVGSSPFGVGNNVDFEALGTAGFWVLWSPVAIPDDFGNFHFARPGELARNNMQSGFMRPNRVLQDAYINYHPAWIPHHDFTIGQFKPPMSEEGNRNSGQLDFVERAMINQFSNQRDLGVMVHGSWWNDRFQYWFGAFNAAGNFHNTFASFQNRSDDNDEKDIAWRMLVRPIWNQKNWGSLELGYSRQDGTHGESGNGLQWIPFGGLGENSLSTTVDGLSIRHSAASRQYAWAWYRPGGPVRGWWLRGEWGSMTDRPGPGVWNVNAPVLQPPTFERSGWYFSTGYKLSDSVWANSLKNHPNWLIKMAHDVEFCYRYEVFGNLYTDGLTAYKGQVPLGGNEFLYLVPSHIDVFKTQVHTAGINYYWRGYNTRTQINYSWVDEPQGHLTFSPTTSGPTGGTVSFTATGRRFREVKNNVFIISQQIMW
ncbi:MAG: hypothetical protein KIS92_23465 [Planctomycetota bacterium]|nr:hypothetical protein [Planctomycetota bacterium]